MNHVVKRTLQATAGLLIVSLFVFTLGVARQLLLEEDSLGGALTVGLKIGTVTLVGATVFVGAAAIRERRSTWLRETRLYQCPCSRSDPGCGCER
jgi:hypothetical protein